MIHHQVVQGSEAWFRVRMGKPTASAFDKLITPGGKPAKNDTSRDYMDFLLAEMILGCPLETFTTAAMQRGKDWEPKARAEYEMLRGVDVELCGFCTDDAETVGASPDSFVGEDGSLEIKCPEPKAHVRYLKDPPSMIKEHRVQVQGQLYVTGRKWTDMVSCFAGMPLVIIRVLPDLEYHEKLALALESFTAEFAELVERAKREKWIVPVVHVPNTDGFLAESDVEAHIAHLEERGEWK